MICASMSRPCAGHAPWLKSANQDVTLFDNFQSNIDDLISEVQTNDTELETLRNVTGMNDSNATWAARSTSIANTLMKRNASGKSGVNILYSVGSTRISL